MKDFLSISADLWERNKRILYSNCDKTNSCWIWEKCKNDDGYGLFGWMWAHGRGARNVTIELAHRMSWIIHNVRNVPDGLYVLHTCDTPGCINPLHLYVGTQYDNVQDMIARGRKKEKHGEERFNAKLTDDAVVEIRATTRSTKWLAEKYGVSTCAVRLARFGKTWKHIPIVGRDQE